MHQATFSSEISGPHLALEREGRPSARGEPFRQHFDHSINAFSVASVSASDARLSVRQRSILGNLTATPDLCRVDAWIPSKPSSNTCSGFTARTGPNFSSVLRRIQASSLRISSSVRPLYALANGTSSPSFHTPNV